MGKHIYILVVFLSVLIVLGACQPAALDLPPTATQTPTMPKPSSTATPTETVVITQTPEPAWDLLVVPEGEPEAIDGLIAPGEWDQAVVERFLDGSEIFVMHKHGYLYLAVRAVVPDMIVGNIYLAVGDQISIMHSSAALGTGRYEKSQETWKLTQAFQWCCRQKSTGEAAQAERDAFFEREGWVSINSWMGTPNELEYKITLPDGDFVLAANYINASSTNEKIPWPGDLSDGSTILTPSGLPQQLQFEPETWRKIQVQP